MALARPALRVPAPGATPTPAARTGDSVLERAAVQRARLEIAAMPASLVVQLVLWPETIAAWARTERVPSSVVYNALHRVKPYHRVRDRLAERLDVSRPALDALIDRLRPLPASLRPPAPPDLAGGAAHPAVRLQSDGWPLSRDGKSPLERKAVYRVELDTAALPASLIVQLAIWPDTLAAWARRQFTSPALVYALLANSQSAERVQTALAKRLGVPDGELRLLIASERQEPHAHLPLALPAASTPQRPTKPERPRSRPRPSGGQLALHLDPQ